MASLIDTYAAQAGVIPGDLPNINVHVYPLPFDKFITLNVTDGKIDSKYYDYWAEVLILLRPALNHFGIKIVQIGGPNDRPISGCDATLLTLTMAQSAYIQKHSILHLGVDSLCVHRASAFGKKIVALFGHTYPEQVGISWSNPEDVAILEPDRKGNHPCFSSQEFPKTINTIRPETICRAVLNLLRLNVNINFETKFIGPLYDFPVIEIIPDFFGESSQLKNHELHIRMDLHFDQEKAHLWAQNYVVRLISDRPVDLELLRASNKNIRQLTLLMDNPGTFNEEYVKSAKKIIPNLVLVGTNNETLSDVRLKFFDWTVERMPSIDRSKFEPYIGCKFWSKKTVFAEAKQFASVAHWKEKKHLDTINFVIDSSEISKEMDHFYVYQ